MVKHYLLLSSFFCFSLLNSCKGQVPLRVKENFSECYNFQDKYYDTKIKFSGYYVNVEPFERRHYDSKTGKMFGTTLDTIYANIIFFSDGLVVTGFSGLNCGNCDIETNSQFISDVSQNKVPEKDSFYNGFNWGLYRIFGDTIKIQVVNHPPRFNPYWYLFEHWYLIKKDGTLFPIYSKNLIDDKVLEKTETTISYRHIETNILLPSETWLKKEKWFWCNEEDWRNYMDSINIKSKK